MSTSWSQVDIDGHGADLFIPSSMNENGYVIVYLHGVHLGRLVDNDVYTRLFEQHRLPVVAPMTMRSWWTDRICEEFDEGITAEAYLLERVIPWIAERFSAAPPGIALLGTSMGGQGALRFAFKHPRTFPVAAGISPAIDYHLRLREADETLAAMYRDEEQARQDTAILHVHPLNWPRNVWFCCDPQDERWFDSADRLQMKLSSMGIPHACDLTTSSGGHGWDYYNHMAAPAIGFLMRALQSERLRVV